MLRAKVEPGPSSWLSGLEVIAVSLPGPCDASIPSAAARSGALGLLNLVHTTDERAALAAVGDLSRCSRHRIGLVLSTPLAEVAIAAIEALGVAEVILLSCDASHELASNELARAMARVRPHARRVGVVVTSRSEADRAVAAGCDLIVAKGHEAGGIVGEETSFILIQSLRGKVSVPLYVWGGVGWNTAAACVAAGCAGVVLDWQLALLRESHLPAAFRRQLSMMDGSEVATFSLGASRYLRFYHQPGMTARSELDRIANELLAAESADSGKFFPHWQPLVNELCARPRAADRLWLAGQDAAFAADWARQAESVGRAIRMLESRVSAQVRAAGQAATLDAGSPLAASHRTRFPVVQGPMTRVSDVAEFCQSVEAHGGLPFLALALMGESQVRSLLEKTRSLMGDRSWGVGMLGFVPQEVRSQQWPVIREIKPPFAIIAGGRPDQAASLEASGIATYLHVPAPGMLDMFLRENARRFVFEGRECGGHVGPRTSFVLWESMVRVLCETELSPEEASKVHVLFAGGIHDRVGSAMVAALAQPLVDRGMKVGVLLGTAYLFTHEIVATGAVVEGFQSVALSADHTVVVQSGPGHAIRCAENDYVDLFEREKVRLLREQRDRDEARAELENLNLGRLRIAAKGVQRTRQNSNLEQVDPREQRREGMYMIGQVAALRSATCSIRELHEEVCLGGQELLRARAHVELLSPAPPPVEPLDIAIVGMACMVPGATDPGRMWHHVLTRHDPITEIPPDRFEVERWFDSDRKARDKIYGKWGGFVADLPFDPLKFGIPPASISSIEPMQLLAMELVDRALMDAGYAGHNASRERTSIILGVGGGAGELGTGYAFRSMLPRFLENPDETLWEQLPEWTEDSFAGILFNVVAGRVSNRLDFGGVNCTVDAACASSLAAIYWACHELASGHCDMAISGGCDTMQNPFGYLCFAKAGALSPRGKARVFDADADGIVISEGHAAVVLKRREDAERDGDKIYAVIRAISSGSDGRSKGLTAPRVEGQLRTLQRAYEQAGVDPRSVALFEAHGTGTAVGDQTEALALTTLLKDAGAPPESAAVGSIKSMIGHTKCAAGAVGLIKTVMALQHRVLPPTAHVEQPNPKGGLVDGPLVVNTVARPWLTGDEPRRAGVSSFGFGGTNFHVILEEYDRSQQCRPAALRRDREQELFVLAGDSAGALRAAARSLANEAAAVERNGADAPLARLAYTHHLRTQRLDKPCRAALVAASLGELQSQLQGFEQALDERGNVSGKLPRGVFYTPTPQGAGAIAFLFPGQGSQHPGMLQELAIEFPEVAPCFERADRALSSDPAERLSRYIFPPPAFSDERRAQDAERLKATERAQPALGVCGLAMCELVGAFDLRPQMTAGHSFGEIVALWAAGAMTEEQLFELAAARGRVMAQVGPAQRGTMLAASADAEAVRACLSGVEGVWIANLNSPTQTVLSGTEQGIAAARQILESAGIASRALPVAAAFHSPIMNEPREAFRQVLEGASFAPPSLGVYSNVTADVYRSQAAEIRDLLAQQLTSEVRFVEQIEAMYRDGARVFIEVGPKSVLTGLVSDILGSRPHLAVATQASGGEPVRQFLAALAQCVAHGVALSLDRLYEARGLEPFDRATLAGKPAAGYAKHIWLVNGAYSRRASEPARSTAPQARLAGPKSASAHPAIAPPQSALEPDAQGGIEEIPSAPAPVVGHELSNGAPLPHEIAAGNGSMQSGPIVNSPPEATGGQMPESDYALFQQTMRQFLLTQENVLRQLFGTGAAQGDHPSTRDVAELGSRENEHVELPVPRVVAKPSGALHAPQALPQQEIAATSQTVAPQRPSPHVAQPRESMPVERHSAQPAAPVLSAESLAGRLTSVVADRTGYPAEMLDLDINLEGELGIDSIKRVEIIAAFRREVLPGMVEPPAEFMESLASAKTMRRIVEVVAQMAGAGSTSAAAPVASPSPASPVDPDDLLATLLGIVADRTGYPAEMLDLDVNLEGELGIDSIKRVEIIAAFRRQVLPGMNEPPAEFMERLAAARTMRAIIEVVVEMAGGSPMQLATVSAASADPATTGLSIDALQSRLVEIVADRTGYPAEMLELDINLESELGIDSIKRVEIIAAFRREVRPDLLEPPPELMERLSAAKTMRAILACFVEPAPAATARPIAPPPVATPAPTVVQQARPVPAAVSLHDACPRCIAEIVESPIGRLNDLADGVIVLTVDDDGLASRWGADFEARGHRVARLHAADLADREAARSAIEAIRRVLGPVAAVAHLLPLEKVAGWPEISADAWNERFAIEVKGLLYLLQAIEPELSRDGGRSIRLLSASLGGGDFAIVASSEATHPWRGALTGLFKVAACEWPRHAFRSVDFLTTPDTELLERELLASGPVEVGYRNGRRLAVQVRRKDLPEQVSREAIDEVLTADDVVLVTGGAKGITAEIVAELASHVPARFVLLGRSPLPDGDESSTTAGIEGDAPLRQAIIADWRSQGGALTPARVEAELARIKSDRQVRRNLAQITQRGAKVDYLCCDARDRQAMAAALQAIQAKYGAINGVIHGAGIIDDRTIKDKTSESFDRVVGTKIDPMLTLLGELDVAALKLVVLFASTSGFFGNSGQVDYAAANEILNRMARRLSITSRGKVVSLNWGPWSGTGMVTPEVAEKMLSQGVELIPVEAGRAAALREIASNGEGQPRAVLGRGPWLEELRLADGASGLELSVCGPLLNGQAIQAGSDGSVIARVTLDRSKPYLQDHCIEGKAVLPVAMAVALMAETAHRARPNWHVAALKNVRMLSGITVEDPDREIVITAEALETDGRSGRWRVRIAAPDAPQRSLYDAHVHLALALPAAPSPSGPRPIDIPLAASAGEAYDRWLFHGPVYQVIEGFTGADESGIDAIVSGASVERFSGIDATWVIDPAVVDAAPQLAMIWSRALFDVAVLPSRISSYRLYEPMGSGKVEMKLRMRPGHDRQVYHADVWIIREGRVIAHMEGLEGAGSPQLNRIAASGAL